MTAKGTAIQSAPAVAILADELLQQKRLRTLLCQAGYEVVVSTSPDNLNPALLDSASIQLWLVEADLTRCSKALHDALTEADGHRVLFDESPVCDRHNAEYQLWERRLLATVARYLESPGTDSAPAPGRESLPRRTATSPQTPLPLPAGLANARPEPSQLWILAASLGGPVAVKAFLDRLPAGLPCYFLYAQHIDSGFQDQLAQSVGRHTALPVKRLTVGSLVPGEVNLIPVDQSIRLSDGHRVHLNPHDWRGPYSPCLDELMQTICEQFAGQCHTIVFSGMAGDALLGSSFVQAAGGEDWLQTDPDCIQPAMPEAIRQAGLHTGQGDPAALAQALIHHLQQQTAEAASSGSTVAAPIQNEVKP